MPICTCNTPVLGAPASIMGRSSHATGLRPFALPHPKHLSTLSASSAVRVHKTRRYGHPSRAVLALSGQGYAELRHNGVLIAAAHDIAGEGAHRLDPGVTLSAEATHQYSLFNRMHVEDLSASVIT
jgi:hypothetical protein